MYLDKINRTICTGQNVPDKMYRTKYTGQNIPDKIYQTKYTGQNIPYQLQTSYTFACQKWLPVVATGFMIEENNSLVMVSSAGWCGVVRWCKVLHRVV